MENLVKEGDHITVWFSCGAASAVAAMKTLEMYKDVANIRIVNNPVAEEHEDNRRFLKDVEKWLDWEIETAINPAYPSCSTKDVWSDRKYMSGVTGAPCTMLLKKGARKHWEKTNRSDWLVLGFTADEAKRAERFKKGEREELIPILVDQGITKQDCFDILTNEGLRLPEVYYMGYPTANCLGCVRATSPTYWNHLRKQFPEVFKERAEMSREYGAKLVRVNRKRIFLDELDPEAKGRPMKSMDIECGIFCEERENKDERDE